MHIKNSLILIDTLTPRSINDCSRCIHLRSSNDFTTFNISVTPTRILPPAFLQPSLVRSDEKTAATVFYFCFSGRVRKSGVESECCLQINLISGNQSTGTTDIFILYTKLTPTPPPTPRPSTSPGICF